MADSDLPADVIAEAERLTRLALAAADDAEAAAYRGRRDDLLADRGYVARERDDDGNATLVCHPAAWLDETGTVRMDAVDATDAVERSLEGPGSPERWADVAEHNREVARRVHAEHGGVHGATVTALAAFASNHYAKPIEDLAPAELDKFREEYFERNAWPSERQRDELDASLRHAVAALDEDSRS